MALDERQLAMLRVLRVPYWQPAAAAVPAAAAQRPASSADADAEAEAALALSSASSAPAVPRAAHPQSAIVADLASGWPKLKSPAVAVVESPPAAPDAPTADVSTLGWPELREAVAGCRACSLCQTRRQTVFGVGHPRAHWMIVGEAPGEQEDQRGEPFVGAAGRLLDNMLAAIGLGRGAGVDSDPLRPADPRRQVYIANTLKCRPPADRNPQPAELQKCEPFLVRQIELVQPLVILAMGRFAVQALLRTDEAIGRLRGRVHHYQGVPLIVTYHPAYLLRNLPDKARAWEDLCLALQTVEPGEPPTTDLVPE